MVKQLILVTMGGGIGSVFRYLTSIWVAKHFPHTFPISTLVVNVIGCFVMGVLINMSGKYAFFGNGLRALLIVGFCGGYTTFSTFSAENLRLYETGSYGILVFYVTASIILGFAALWLGSFLSKMITL